MLLPHVVYSVTILLQLFVVAKQRLSAYTKAQAMASRSSNAFCSNYCQASLLEFQTEKLIEGIRIQRIGLLY